MSKVKVIVTAVPDKTGGIAKVSLEYLVPCGIAVVPHGAANDMLSALRSSGAEIMDLREPAVDMSLVI